MFSDLFIDLPLAVIGYVAAVLAISKYLEIRGGAASGEVRDAPVKASEDLETLVSTTDRWDVKEEDGLTPDTALVTRFDSDTGVISRYPDIEISHVPTDAVLQRHYIQYLLMMLGTLREEPTDCQLRRHYQQYLEYRIEGLLEDRDAVARLEAEYEARHLSF